MGRWVGGNHSWVARNLFLLGLLCAEYELKPSDTSGDEIEKWLERGLKCQIITSMSGRGSSQEVVYRKVGGNMAGASTLFSASTVAIWGTRPTHT